ncbi:hypothetical protein [Nonomuraea sp. KM90]|uniref:hypothetical protein n=1 Tax=Nonomuraea sp. KM90 TaxID=3457428 RepID=UPI003FCE935A
MMRLSQLVMLLVALGGCAAAPAGVPSPSAPDVLLEAGQLAGSWTEVRTADVTWADLEEGLVPCSRRAIVPGGSPVRFREFRSADGASVVQLVVSRVDGTQSFKRFYAECLAVGGVESEPGPRYVASHRNETEIAGFAGDRLVIVSGPAGRDDLRAIADAARRNLGEG